MKITTDVNSAGLRPTGGVLPRTSSGTRINVSDAKVAQDVIQKMQREKSMIDALAIAQSSRELVQKALNVSSRLMSLASEAMITGRVNSDEVSSQMSSINSSIGGYGERISVPVEGTPVPADETQMKLDRSFEKIREKGELMLSGKTVAAAEFEPVIADLKGAASQFDVKINNYTSELGSIKKIDNPNYNYPGLNRDTAGIVQGNPVQALTAQGNISYEIASKLTMA